MDFGFDNGSSQKKDSIFKKVAPFRREGGEAAAVSGSEPPSGETLAILTVRIGKLEKSNAELRDLVARLSAAGPPPPPPPRPPADEQHLRKVMKTYLDERVEDFGRMTSSLVEYLRSGFKKVESKSEEQLLVFGTRLNEIDGILKKESLDVDSMREAVDAATNVYAGTLHRIELVSRRFEEIEGVLKKESSTVDSLRKALEAATDANTGALHRMEFVSKKLGEIEAKTGGDLAVTIGDTFRKVALLEARFEYFSSSVRGLEEKNEILMCRPVPDNTKIEEINRGFFELQGRFEHIFALFNYFRDLAGSVRVRQNELEMKVNSLAGPPVPRGAMDGFRRDSELHALIAGIGDGKRAS